MPEGNECGVGDMSACPPGGEGADAFGNGNAGRRQRILAVDDDTLIAMSTVELLEELGYEVLEANSGEEALAILHREDAVDLLLTDYSMPGMNGVELAEAALAMRPGLPVLIASGYAELPSGSGLDLPRLAKPYQQAQLANAVMSLLQGQLPPA